MMIPPDIPGFPGVYQLMALKSYRRGEKGGVPPMGRVFGMELRGVILKV